MLLQKKYSDSDPSGVSFYVNSGQIVRTFKFERSSDAKGNHRVSLISIAAQLVRSATWIAQEVVINGNGSVSFPKEATSEQTQSVAKENRKTPLRCVALWCSVCSIQQEKKLSPTVCFYPQNRKEAEKVSLVNF